MSQESLLTVPATLSILKQAYCIVDQNGDVQWANGAFQKYLDSLVFDQIKEHLKPVRNSASILDLRLPNQEPVCIELEFQPYSEIVSEEGEGFLSLCV